MSNDSKKDAEEKAKSRLKHLEALRMLGKGTDVKVELTENMSVSAKSVTCVNAEMSEVMVEQLETSLGTLPNATLRGSNIIAIDVAIQSDGGKEK